MRKRLFFVTMMILITLFSKAQFGMGSVNVLKNVKESKLYVVDFVWKGYKDYNERKTSFINAVQKYWNFCNYEVITSEAFSKMDKTTRASSYFMQYNEPEAGEGVGKFWITIQKGKIGDPWLNIAAMSFDLAFQTRENLIAVADEYVKIFNNYLNVADSIGNWNVVATVNQSAGKLKDATLIIPKGNFGIKFNEEKIRMVYKHPIEMITLGQMLISIKNQEQKACWIVLSCYHTYCDAVIDIPTGQILYLGKPAKSSFGSVPPNKDNLFELSTLVGE